MSNIVYILLLAVIVVLVVLWAILYAIMSNRDPTCCSKCGRPFREYPM